MNTWILIMTIFISPQNSKFQMEALSTYSNKNQCVVALRRALAIQMPVARQFRCLKIRHIPSKQQSTY